jgi:hypothetical protein
MSPSETRLSTSSSENARSDKVSAEAKATVKKLARKKIVTCTIIKK